MTKSRISWETLNAYVDGELTPREAAEVARCVARDTDAAAQVAAISALKAATRDTVEPVEGIVLPEPERRSRRRVVLAASIVAAAILAGLTMAGSIEDELSAELEVAHQMHHEWIDSNRGLREADPAYMLETSLAHLDLMAYVPDLSEVDLRFTHIRALPAQAGAGLHVGYLGARGCMLSLVIMRDPVALSSARREVFFDDRTGYTWTAGRYGYILLADRMDPARLARVAVVIERLTRRNAALTARDRVALDESRAQSQPCLT